MECDDGGGGGDVRLFPPLSSSSSSAGGAGAEMGNFREVAPSIHPGHFFFREYNKYYLPTRAIVRTYG
jgi:hypothetical protein